MGRKQKSSDGVQTNSVEHFADQMHAVLGVKKETVTQAIQRSRLSPARFSDALAYSKILFPHQQITEGFTGATEDLLDKIFVATRDRKPMDMYMAFGGRISGEVPLGILKYVYYTGQVSREVGKLFGRTPKTTILLSNSYYLKNIMGFEPVASQQSELAQRKVLEKGVKLICQRFGVSPGRFNIVSYDQLRTSPEGRRFVEEFLKTKQVSIGKSGFESLVNMAKKAKNVSHGEAEQLADAYATEQVIEASLIMHSFKPGLKVVEPSEEIFDVAERNSGISEVKKRPSIVLRGQRQHSKDVHVVGPAYHPHDAHAVDNVFSYNGGDISGFLAKQSLSRRGDLARMAVMHGTAHPRLLDRMQTHPDSTFGQLRKIDKPGFNRVRNFVKGALQKVGSKKSTPRRVNRR